jgi:DNA-binding CsgD family transcriptional regulator
MAGGKRGFGRGFVYVAGSFLLLNWYKKVALLSPGTDRLVFILALACGVYVAAFLSDKIKLPPSRQAMYCAAFAAVLTPGMLLPGAFRYVFLVASSFFVGASFILLMSHGLAKVRYNRRGLYLSLTFAISGFVNTTTDLAELPALNIASVGAKIAFSACAAALVALILLRFGKSLDEPVSAPLSGGLPKRGSYSRVATLVGVSAVLIYTVFNLHDSTSYPVGLAAAASSQFLRYAEVPVFVFSGIMTDRFGRQTMLFASLICAVIGAFGALLPPDPAISMFVSLGAGGSNLVFLVVTYVLFADLSRFSKRPAALCGTACLCIVISELLVFPIVRVSTGFSTYALFTAGILPCIALIPIFTSLMDKIRAQYADLRQYPAAPSARFDESPSECGEAREGFNMFVTRLGFTNREQEIFSLLISGKSSEEIVRNLYIAPGTLRFHVSNLLKKTGTNSRAELVITYAYLRSDARVDIAL